MKRMLATFVSLLLCLSALAVFPGALLAAGDPAKAYADTLLRLRAGTQNGSYDSWDLPIDDLSDLGYAFADLDGDGSEELIVLSPEDVILFIYTLIDGEATRVVSSTGNEYCTKIDESGSIYITRKDANPPEETHYVYALNGGTLAKLWQLNVAYDESGAPSKWQYQNNQNRMFTLSEEEGFAMLAEIDAPPALPMDFNPFQVEASAESAAQKYKKLQRGNKGDEVLALQTRLIELGYLEGDADGKFGNGTEAAVASFQRNHGLEANGVAGSATQRILFGTNVFYAPQTTATPSPEETPALAPAATAAETPEPQSTPAPTSAPAYKTLQRGHNGDTMAALQARLKEQGYLEGDADGKFGGGTEAAVRSFQTDRGLTADGIADPETQRLLFGE